MKKKLIIIGGVLIVLLGALIVAPNLIDWNAYKPQVADGFEAATGQKIRLDGDLSFKLWPSPALRASDVSLANWPGGEAANFLEMEGLDIRLELFPLLSGDVKITSLVVDGGKIFLERDLDGRANWEVLFDKGETEAQPEEEGEVAMESFILRDTDIHYSDPAADIKEAVMGINADLIITSLAGPFTGSGDFVYQDVPVDFNFATGLFSEGANVPIRLTFIADGNDPGLQFQGTFVQEKGVTGLSGSLVGKGDSLAPLITLAARAGGMEAEPAGPFDRKYSLDTNLLLVLTPEKSDVVLDPFKAELGPSAMAGTIQLLYAKTLEAKTKLSINTLKAEDWMGEEEDSDEPFELPGDIKADFDIEVAKVSYAGGDIANLDFKGALDGGRLTIENFAAVLPGNSDLRLTGDVRAQNERPFMNAKVHLDARAFRDLASWLEVDLSAFPSNRVTRYTFDGQVRLADPALEIIGATMTLDSTRFQGGATLDLDDPSLFAIAGTLNNLDLDTYYPDLTQKKEYASLGEKIESWQEGLQALTGYQGIIDIKAERLKMAGANITGISLKAGLAGNDIEITNLTVGSLEGAALKVSGAIRDIPGQMNYTLNAGISSETFKALLAWMETESPFDERVVPQGTINAKLTGSKNAARYDLSGDLSGIGFGIKGNAENLLGKPVYTADLTLSHPRTIEFIRKFSPDYFPAKTPIGAFQLKTAIKGDEADMRLDGISLSMGPAKFEGNIRYQAPGARPMITGAITTGRLVMDDFMAPVEAGVEEVAEGGQRWSEDEWDTTFLKDNDFDISLAADSVVFRTYTFGRPRVRLKAKDRVMTVEDMRAGFFGGTLTANAVMDVTGIPFIKATLNMNDVSTQEVLKSSADITRLTGKLDFEGTFEGKGKTQKAFIQTLSGTSKLATTNGEIRGINMPRLSEQMGTLNNLAAFTSLLGRAFEGGQTPYRYIRAAPKVTNGVISFDQIESDVDATDIGGRGRIDLPKWTMDASGALRLKDHPDVPAIGVNMKGRVDAPSVKYDYAALTNHMTTKFTDTLFQNLLGNKQAPAEKGGEGGGTPAEGVEEKKEPTPEEQMLKGIFDLLGKDEDDEEEGDDDDGEGGGG